MIYLNLAIRLVTLTLELKDKIRIYLHKQLLILHQREIHCKQVKGLLKLNDLS